MLTLGVYVSLFISSYFFDLAYQICLISYSLLTLFTMIFLNRKMAERAVNTIRLAQTNETIRILLRDFEENASEWLWETGPAGEIKHVSARFAEVARQPVDTIRGDLLGLCQGRTGLSACRGTRRGIRSNRYAAACRPARHSATWSCRSTRRASGAGGR
jgi:hypothetical protein